MIKKILIYTFAFACTFCSPMAVNAAVGEWGAVEQQIDEPGINIAVSQSTLHITGAAGQVLEIVSLTGKPVASIRIESPAQRVELNLPKGCYILKIGKVVRKVSVH